VSGSKPPFFCVGGGVINMSNLARELGDEQPFYALQWQSLGVDRIMYGTVEDAASDFIQAMHSIQPEGPYYLGGSFASGVVAVEMARQLEAQGEEVALLVGFDAIVRSYQPPVSDEPKKKRNLFQKIVHRLRKGDLQRLLLKGDLRGLWTRIEETYDFVEASQHFVWKIGYRAATAIGRPVPMWMRTGIFEEFCILRATDRHEPTGKYSGNLELFLTPDRHQNVSKYPRFSWEDFVSGEVEARLTPGDPCSIMIDPNVDRLAVSLNEQLEPDLGTG